MFLVEGLFLGRNATVEIKVVQFLDHFAALFGFLVDFGLLKILRVFCFDLKIEVKFADLEIFLRFLLRFVRLDLLADACFLWRGLGWGFNFLRAGLVNYSL